MPLDALESSRKREWDQLRMDDDDVDCAEDGLDVEVPQHINEVRQKTNVHPRGTGSRTNPNHRRSTSVNRPSVHLDDLDSPSGRAEFVFSSIVHLFSTTYESSDDMTVSALLTYLNAAMPPDKYEDFDTAEVVRAVAALQGRGEIIFEGDFIHLLY